MSEKKNKREIIAELIEAGGATKEKLMEAAEVNAAGLASQFTYLRLTGRYPVKGEDGVYRFVSEEEWEAMKAEAAARRGSSKKRTPAEKKELIEKRLAKAQDAYVRRKEAFEKDKTELNKWKFKKAEAEVEIANLELEAVKQELGEE